MPWFRVWESIRPILLTLVDSWAKRLRPVFGSTVEDHGGILDRMDSICFSAPLFFHLTALGFYLATSTVVSIGKSITGPPIVRKLKLLCCQALSAIL
jgi:Cytidylyltransferase family